MLNLGLLGKNIQNSRSKEMYEKLLLREINYHLFDFSKKEDIPDLNFIFSNVSGLSITAPFKDFFLDKVQLNDDIKPLNAINCIKKVGANFIATNTDYLACLEILNPFFKKNIKFIILGDGAMSRVLQYTLTSKQEDYEVKSRRLGNLDNLNFSLSQFNKKYLIINCCHRDYNFIGDVDDSLIKFWDLNYDVSLDKHSRVINSIKYVDGLELLFLQAKYALDFWEIK